MLHCDGTRADAAASIRQAAHTAQRQAGRAGAGAATAAAHPTPACLASAPRPAPFALSTRCIFLVGVAPEVGGGRVRPTSSDRRANTLVLMNHHATVLTSCGLWRPAQAARQGSMSKAAAAASCTAHLSSAYCGPALPPMRSITSAYRWVSSVCSRQAQAWAQWAGGIKRAQAREPARRQGRLPANRHAPRSPSAQC